MQKHLLWTLLFFSAWQPATAATTACHATYQVGNNRLQLPCVQVASPSGAVDTYQATLSLDTFDTPFHFSLIGAAAAALPAGAEACYSRYEVLSGRLQIPCLVLSSDAARENYRATLQTLPAAGGLSFMLADLVAEALPDDSTETAEATVVLLLHGMNSSELTWNDYVDLEPVLAELTDKCPTIALGVVEGGAQLPASPPAMGCYRLRFGGYDALSGRIGVEGIRAEGPRSGDFSTFEQLGNEVGEAISTIRYAYGRAYPEVDVKITLVGHSRGGLAARAFLQQGADSPEKQSVVALLTTGTPHYGSPLGRVYQYLQRECQHENGERKGEFILGVAADDCAEDWQVVDFLRARDNCALDNLSSFFSSEDTSDRLDVRRPTIDDLSDQSAAIAELNARAYRLPADIVYGALKYTGVELGRINAMYRIFDRDGFDVCHQVSKPAERWLLAPTDNPEGENLGDGIVPEVNQGFPAGIRVQAVSSGSYTNIYHIEQPGQKEQNQQYHISKALTVLLANPGKTP